MSSSFSPQPTTPSEITGTGPDGRPVVSWVSATKAKVRLAANRFAGDKVRFSVVPVDSLGRRGRALTY